ncbi:MAG TPA: CocE/NonD family hydrolase [Phycisphaerae bacterium]|nr:CocE/NonD family hydrolase [Phycisphaerae bacterium]
MNARTWRRARTVCVLSLALWAVGVCPAFAQDEAAPTTAPAALPAGLAGFSDQGHFDLYVNEEPLVAIDFEWKPDGAFHNTYTIAMAGQSVTWHFGITPAPDGRWKTMIQDSPLGPITLEREGGVARRTMKEKVETIDMKPGTVLFQNFSPALMTQAVLQYDQAEGGRQTFPLFIIPSLVMEATLERMDTVQRPIDGRDVEFTRYTYGVPGVDVIIWVDRQQRICLGDVPAQHAAYVREGYGSLRVTPVADAKLSAPDHEVEVQANVGVPMRDGVELATDVYRPDGQGPFPAILVRTPYKKEMSELQARYYARRGYVFAIQDCRGRFASPGVWEPFVNEGDDGYDTIEWLAVRPWCNGKVGMIGASYLGWVQWWAASRNPPHLVTIIPNVAPPDPLYNIPYEYGAFFLVGAIWWADVLETEATADLSGAAISKIGEKKYGKLLRSLPVIELDKAVLGKENPYWRKWIRHPVNDDYWARVSFLDRLQDVRIPVFHQSGWFDGDGIGSKLNYLKMRSHGHPHQKLVLGPWGHTPQAQRRLGDRDFGPKAIIDLQTAYLRWFDHWLKGVDNGILDEPLVSIFVMQSNDWLNGDVYPLPQTRFEKWHLHSDGKANTSTGDGRLTPEPPSAESPPDRYTYDPGDPTPNPGFYEEPEQPEGEKAEVKSVEQKKKERQAHHENVTQSRQDILVYTSEPLKEPLTFAGPISAVLYASSSGRDTDWFVRLIEVEPDGKLFPLVEGKIRARFRDSMAVPELLEPGRVYEYRLDLWQTGITISEGHRLRVEVASASFPLFSRNLNTGGHNEMDTEYVPAEQTIHHSAQYPSHVLLPVIPKEEEPPKP